MMDLVHILGNAYIVEYDDKTIWIEEVAVLPFDMYMLVYSILL